MWRTARAKSEQQMSIRVKTPEASLSYPALFEPNAMPKQPGQPDVFKYQAVLVFDEEADLSALKKAANDVGIERFGDKFPALVKAGKVRWPFRKGDEPSYMHENGTPKQGFGPGKTIISCNSAEKPGVVGRYAGPDGKPLEITNPKEVYAGCKIRATVTAFAYDMPTSKGVSFALNNVQKLGDGKRLDGRVAATDDFEALESEPASMDDDSLDDILK